MSVSLTYRGRVTPTRYLLRVALSLGTMTNNELDALCAKTMHPWIKLVCTLELERRKELDNDDH